MLASDRALKGNKAHGRIEGSGAGNGGRALRTRRWNKAMKSANAAGSSSASVELSPKCGSGPRGASIASAVARGARSRRRNNPWSTAQVGARELTIHPRDVAACRHGGSSASGRVKRTQGFDDGGAPRKRGCRSSAVSERVSSLAWDGAARGAVGAKTERTSVLHSQCGMDLGVIGRLVGRDGACGSMNIAVLTVMRR